jgi:adenosylmethionine-8-amino-7-oxononanoate aminotransferase
MDRKHWYEAGLDHVWLPYTQMKLARPPLAVARTEGCRIVLTDGRELIDGIASWWTACHGYNHPHIRQAVERQLATMPHVMFGGLVHEQALILARRLAALLPGDLDRVFFPDRSVAVEIAMKMAQQFWINRGSAKAKFVVQGRLSRRHRGAMAVSDPEPACTRVFRGLLAEHVIVDLPGRAAGRARPCWRGTPTASPVDRRAAGAGRADALP